LVLLAGGLAEFGSVFAVSRFFNISLITVSTIKVQAPRSVQTQ